MAESQSNRKGTPVPRAHWPGAARKGGPVTCRRCEVTKKFKNDWGGEGIKAHEGGIKPRY